MLFDFGKLFQFYCGGGPRGFRPLRRNLVRLLPSEASQLRSGRGGVGGGGRVGGLMIR